MKTTIESERKNVWPYVVWPPIVLNAGSVLLIGAMYAFKYATSTTQSPGIIQIGSGQIQFALSILIFLVEWLFALLLIYKYRRSNESVRSLFSSTDNPLKFRWVPAILLFVFSNGIFIGYILYLISSMPDLTYRDMTPLQIILFLLLTPITAAFTEELIWRGHIISGFELRGNNSWVALLISSTSFALIHGVFFPDKLLATFLIGIVTGIYYVRERTLLPIMFTHWLMDVWSFGIFLFR
jgi:membrane protease YdiL (CAAX protease family)